MKYVLPEYPQVVWTTLHPTLNPLFWSLSASVLWGNNPQFDCPEMLKRIRCCYWITGLQYHAFLFNIGIKWTFTTGYLFGQNLCCLSIHKWFVWPCLPSWLLFGWNLCCLSIHKWLGWPCLPSRLLYFGHLPPLSFEEMIGCLIVLKCERETEVATKEQEYSTMHLCLRLALNEHLQWVTCLGEICVTSISTSGLDGTVSDPDCCSWVPLWPSPIRK